MGSREEARAVGRGCRADPPAIQRVTHQRVPEVIGKRYQSCELLKNLQVKLQYKSVRRAVARITLCNWGASVSAGSNKSVNLLLTVWVPSGNIW